MGAEQFSLGVVDIEAVVVQQAVRYFAIGAGLEPFFIGVVDELAVGDFLAEILVVIEEVAVHALNELAQC